MRSDSSAALGPLVLEEGRLRPRPGLDIQQWAIEETRRIVLDAIRDQEIDAYLFGSRARGDARPCSDIDVALYAHDDAVPKAPLALLRERLEESLIPFEVDVVDLADASETLRAAVLREGREWTT